MGDAKVLFRSNYSDNSDYETSDIVPRSLPFALSSDRFQDEDVGVGDGTTNVVMELDETTHDPSWRPEQTTKSSTSDENQGKPQENWRYYLRSHARLNSEPQFLINYSKQFQLRKNC